MQERGRILRRVEQPPGRPADNAPAAGGGLGVDARLLPGDAHRAGGHAGARRGQAGRGQGLRQAAQVGEARREAQHVHPVGGAGMQPDHLFHGEAVVLSDELNIGAKLPAVDHRDFFKRRLRQGDRRTAGGYGGHLLLNVGEGKLLCIVVDQERAIGRDGLAQAGQARQRQGVGQRLHLAIDRLADLVGELHQQGGIASGEEAGVVSHGLENGKWKMENGD